MSKLTKSEIRNRKELKRNKPLVYDKVLQFHKKLKNNESFAIIQLHYSYLCNMRCSHCSISTLKKKSGRMLDVETVKKIMDEADKMGLAHVDLTGGEPVLFKELDDVIKAIGPERFYIQVDTNGWLMTDEKAQHLKEIGVDKIQLSIDSLDRSEHDSFRNKKGSFDRAIKAIESIKKADLKLQIATVVTHSRLKSQEFLDFLEFTHNNYIAMSICWGKPVGEWEGNYEELITSDDVSYMNELQKKYNIYDHLTPAYGLNLGCIAVKRMISITAYGDVMPCPWMYFSLGNIFDDSLENILNKGMRYFGEFYPKCRMSNDINFIKKYVSKTYGKQVPVPIEEIMGVK